jgi:hypothetical protein
MTGYPCRQSPRAHAVLHAEAAEREKNEAEVDEVRAVDQFEAVRSSGTRGGHKLASKRVLAGRFWTVRVTGGLRSLTGGDCGP